MVNTQKKAIITCISWFSIAMPFSGFASFIFETRYQLFEKSFVVTSRKCLRIKNLGQHILLHLLHLTFDLDLLLTSLSLTYAFFSCCSCNLVASLSRLNESVFYSLPFRLVSFWTSFKYLKDNFVGKKTRRSVSCWLWKIWLEYLRRSLFQDSGLISIILKIYLFKIWYYIFLIKNLKIH